MRLRKRPIAVVSAFIRRNKKYLLVYDPRFNFWRVPGGRLVFNERAEEALKREMKEELNIGLEVGSFLGFGQDIVSRGKRSGSRIILYFECKVTDGKLKTKAKDEISKTRWLTEEEIKKIGKLEPAMRDFFLRSKKI